MTKARTVPVPTTDPPVELDLRRLVERLAELVSRQKSEPSFNPVLALSLELSHDLESGERHLDDLKSLVKALADRAFLLRGRRLNAYVGPVVDDENITALQSVIEAVSGETDFDGFQRFWSEARAGCVFTGHPTFLMSAALRQTLVTIAETNEPPEGALEGLRHAPDPVITLMNEHEAAMEAVGYAKDAIATVHRILIEDARRRFPAAWRTFVPAAVNVGTWVGYDMDGRTDIQWYDGIRFRLDEKYRQLGRYRAATEGVLFDLADRAPDVHEPLSGVLARIAGAMRHAERTLKAFEAPMDDLDALTAAANLLTANHPDKLVDVTPLLQGVDVAIEACADDVSVSLMVLRAEMTLFGLGAAEVHFRINATQLHNALSRLWALPDGTDLSGRTGLALVTERIESVASERVNFASLALEGTTAIRQFITMAQFLKHIDSGSAIRLLIAECEAPVTVLAALYFGRLVGIEDKVDVSPLLETEPALEKAGRFLEVLLSNPAFQSAVRKRGRFCIQTGFSDAGRFMGQIPATLAIERMQGQIADLAEQHALSDIDFLIFNTHGESMGRGAHPDGLRDRVDYVLSPWARRQYRDRNLTLLHEISFQGGDGYVPFGSPRLALATLVRLIEATEADSHDAVDGDPFYHEHDLTFDFYRQVKRYQEELLDFPDYHRTLSALGLALLNDTGSRKTRRQFEVTGDQGPSIRRIRAIPHNAILQQLGNVVNVIGGIGVASRSEEDRFVDMCRRSDRARLLFRMIERASGLSSLKVMAAYGSLFDGNLWATRPYYGREETLIEPCLYLAGLLGGDARFHAALNLATRLRIDSLMRRHVLDALGHSRGKASSDEREILRLLHAIRLTLIQHIFLLAARVPQFSTRNDISRNDIMELVFELRIPEVTALLRDAYPVRTPRPEQFVLEEEASYPGPSAAGYTAINASLIDQIERAYDLVLEAGVGIAHVFGAHG